MKTNEQKDKTGYNSDKAQSKRREEINKEQNDKREHSGKEMTSEPTTEAIKLDEDIRNDIDATEINPHVQKRVPLEDAGKDEKAEQWAKEQRQLEDQQEEIKKNRFNGL